MSSQKSFLYEINIAKKHQNNTFSGGNDLDADGSFVLFFRFVSEEITREIENYKQIKNQTIRIVSS